MMAWSSLAHSVLMRSLRSLRSVMHVLYTFSCSLPHCSHLDLNPVNLEATVEAEWILVFLSLRKQHFSMKSQLHHQYVVLCKYWWDFLQFFTRPECRYDLCQNYEKLSKSVKIMIETLSVPFSFGHGVVWVQCSWKHDQIALQQSTLVVHFKLQANPALTISCNKQSY